MKYFFFFLITLYQFSSAQTPVSGGIFSDAVWTKASSPYVVVNTVAVYPGVTLTIEPGVTVRFKNGKLLEVKQGRLIAEGTSADSITFTRDSSAGYWNSIYLNGGNLVSKFSYCNFLYGDSPIDATSIWYSLSVKNSNFSFNTTAIQHINDVHVDSCNFDNNQSGIYGLGSTGTVYADYCSFSHHGSGQAGIFRSKKVVVNNCDFVNNTYAGIYNGSSIMATNCDFLNNFYGIFFHYVPSETTDTIINSVFSQNVVGYVGSGIMINCDISNNSYRGCLFGGGQMTNVKLSFNGTAISRGTGTLLMDSCEIYSNNMGIVGGGSLKISNSEIKYNNGCGISTGASIIDKCVIMGNDSGIFGGGNWITRNIIDSNSSIGIYANNGSTIIGNYIGHGNVGIETLNSNTNYNIIENNIIGINAKGESDIITCNKICNNTEYNLVYANSQNTNLFANNYWCSSDSAFIASTIYDGYDTVTGVGIVYFIPVDTEECYLTPMVSVEPTIFSNETIFKIFPNPLLNGKFKLNIASWSPQQEINFTIFNIFGEKVHQSEISTIESEVDISNQPPGIYFLTANINGQLQIFKIIKL